MTARAHQIGLASDERMRKAEQKARESAFLLGALKGTKELEWIRREECRLRDLPMAQTLLSEAVKDAEIAVKYEGYLKKEAVRIRAAQITEGYRLPEDIDYAAITALRIESRQKLARQKPVSLGQAARIPGVTPADVAVLQVWIKKNSAQSGIVKQAVNKGL